MFRAIRSIGLGMFLSLITTEAAFAAKKITDSSAFLDTIATKGGVEKTDVVSYAGIVIQSALTLLGLIFFILMVYSGFRWMTARGSEEDISKARETIIAATIGLIIIIASYAITNVITGNLFQ